MRTAKIQFNRRYAGLFIETDNKEFIFNYDSEYQGPPISLTMPLEKMSYHFKQFPAFFDGLLPEGPQLEALLRQNKIDKYDYFSQLIAVGNELVGAITVSEEK
jgi:serine/threonine-protein kinase HipA